MGMDQGAAVRVSRWPFTGSEPEWHRAQGEKWDALEAAGWVFRAPPYDDKAVGIEMRRAGFRAAVYVDIGRKELLEIHTRLLAACQAIHESER